MTFDEYKSIPYEGNGFQISILWDDFTCWINTNQLETLFHAKQGQLNGIMRKVLHIYPRDHYNHSKKIGVILERRGASSDITGEWMRQVNHYDLRFLVCMREFKRSREVDNFLKYAHEIQANLIEKKNKEYLKQED